MQCSTAAVPSCFPTLPPHIGVASSSGEEGSPSGLTLLPAPRVRTGTPQIRPWRCPSADM
ncbi:hypothetical protein DPMN_099438 [Dreissena polymorpha]|uniref:Uncharacterized protein n=1 Tax=Dreissena polymorpha TaxID=45954 RepID=A0A9D4R787_DREPO|nr:hypothetical protein DPMN_099438 [Dreissena polymorpha]